MPTASTFTVGPLLLSVLPTLSHPQRHHNISELLFFPLFNTKIQCTPTECFQSLMLHPDNIRYLFFFFFFVNFKKELNSCK